MSSDSPRQPPLFSIAGFSLDNPIGRGATSRVYSARSPTGTPVAVKLVRPGTPTLERCRQAALRLSHPHAIVGTPIPGHNALQMPLLDGAHLHGPLSVHRTLDVARRAASLLLHLHRRDVVHRDMKPANLVVDGHDVFLVDFGSSVCHPVLTLGSPEGSPAYMAPEALLDWSSAPPVDLFALGVTLYELHTGRLPFATGTLAGDLRQKQLRLWTRIADPVLGRLVEALLEPHPVDRWTAARAVAYIERVIGAASPREAASACRRTTA